MSLPYFPTYLFSTSLIPLLRHKSTIAYFGAILLSFNFLLLCYIVSNIKLYSSRMRCMRLFPCRQPKLCRRPQTVHFFISIKIKYSLTVHLWYTTAHINGDIQECMHFLLLNLILLGMINTFHMCKR